MILKALQFSASIVNQYLIDTFQLNDTKVILNDVVDENGSIPQLNRNKLVLSLINIQKETNKPFYNQNKKLADGNYTKIAPMEHYNLDIMVSSHFDDYEESIKFLNASLLFFEEHPIFDENSVSILPLGIRKLELEMDAISYHEMSNLWSAIGAKYRPSIIYKMRLVTIVPTEIKGSKPVGATTLKIK